MAKQRTILTQADYDAIRKLIEVTLDEKLDEKLEAKLNEKLAYLPTKEEFYAKMDEIMAELKAMREEHTILSHRVYSNHEDRITSLEDIRSHGQH